MAKSILRDSAAGREGDHQLQGMGTAALGDFRSLQDTATLHWALGNLGKEQWVSSVLKLVISGATKRWHFPGSQSSTSVEFG